MLAICLFAIRAELSKRAEQKRYADYARATKAYSDALKPGTTRGQVENFLKLRNLDFRRMCCIGPHDNAPADLVRIGKERPPWYCSESNVYVALRFVASAPHTGPETHDDDKLLTVTLYPWLEECL